MNAPVFIGDRVTAAGYHLAGFRTISPARSDLSSTFARVLGEAPLVVLSQAHASALPADLLADAIALATPPVALVPDVQGTSRNLTDWVRRSLGVEG
jgi:vacuolar-type H+-ATPase subunit F/Vma7